MSKSEHLRKQNEQQCPSVPATGMVMNQESRIRLATIQCTALYRSAAPTPMMEEDTIWLAETGAPSSDAPKITDPAVSWEAKEWMGWTL